MSSICEFLQGSVLAVRRSSNAVGVNPIKKFANKELLRSILSFFYQPLVVTKPKNKKANFIIDDFLITNPDYLL